jgi:hypothetical protein
MPIKSFFNQSINNGRQRSGTEKMEVLEGKEGKEWREWK